MRMSDMVCLSLRIAVQLMPGLYLSVGGAGCRRVAARRGVGIRSRHKELASYSKFLFGLAHCCRPKLKKRNERVNQNV